MRLTGLFMVLALGQMAGPPPPAEPKATAADEAIALSHLRNDPPAIVKPCRQVRTQEDITICGRRGDRSPYRLPLPDERPERSHPGEARRVDIGTGPVPVVPGTTVARFGMSRAAKEHGATLKVVADQAREKADAAERAKKIEIVHAPDGTIRAKSNPDDL